MQSPLQPRWNRVLQVGDASGIQSPLSFGGFGALTRHLGRLRSAITEALEAEALDKDSLAQVCTVPTFQTAKVHVEDKTAHVSSCKRGCKSQVRGTSGRCHTQDAQKYCGPVSCLCCCTNGVVCFRACLDVMLGADSDSHSQTSDQP